MPSRASIPGRPVREGVFSRAVLTSGRMHSRDGGLTLRDLPRAHPFKHPTYQHCGPKRANQLLPFAITDHVGGGLDRIP